MKNFISINSYNGIHVIVNVDHIIEIREVYGGSEIRMEGDGNDILTLMKLNEIIEKMEENND